MKIGIVKLFKIVLKLSILGVVFLSAFFPPSLQQRLSWLSSHCSFLLVYLSNYSTYSTVRVQQMNLVAYDGWIFPVKAVAVNGITPNQPATLAV